MNSIKRDLWEQSHHRPVMQKLHTASLNVSHFTQQLIVLAKIAFSMRRLNIFLGVSTAARKRNDMIKMKGASILDRLFTNVTEHSVSPEYAVITDGSNGRVLLSGATSHDSFSSLKRVSSTPLSELFSPLLKMGLTVLSIILRMLFTVFLIPIVYPGTIAVSIALILFLLSLRITIVIGICMFLGAFLAPRIVPVPPFSVLVKLIQWLFSRAVGTDFGWHKRGSSWRAIKEGKLTNLDVILIRKQRELAQLTSMIEFIHSRNHLSVITPPDVTSIVGAKPCQFDLNSIPQTRFPSDFTALFAIRKGASYAA